MLTKRKLDRCANHDGKNRDSKLIIRTAQVLEVLDEGLTRTTLLDSSGATKES
jgi:hypothetical protein